MSDVVQVQVARKMLTHDQQVIIQALFKQNLTTRQIEDHTHIPMRTIQRYVAKLNNNAGEYGVQAKSTGESFISVYTGNAVDVVEEVVRGGRTWGRIRSIPTVNLALSVPYGQEAVEVTLGPVEMNGSGFPRGPGTAQPCTRPSWCLG